MRVILFVDVESDEPRYRAEFSKAVDMDFIPAVDTTIWPDGPRDLPWCSVTKVDLWERAGKMQAIVYLEADKTEATGAEEKDWIDAGWTTSEPTDLLLNEAAEDGVAE